MTTSTIQSITRTARSSASNSADCSQATGAKPCSIVPFFAACCKRNADILEAQAIRLLGILQAENWADLEQFWRNLKWGDRVDVLEALTEKINEIEKDGE